MSFFQNTCKPEGFGGKFMVATMNIGHTPLANWGFSHITLREDWTCLDVGCGGGKNVRHMLAGCPKGSVKGIDYSEVSVKKSRSYNKAEIESGRCEIIHGNVMELPFGENTFDLVTAFETVYFWPNLEKAFMQIHKVLKRGGTFLICNECVSGEEKAEKWMDVIEGMSLYSAEQLSGLLETVGFTQIKADKSDKGWMCVTAMKGSN